MKQIAFYRALKQYCIDHSADCANCILRLYCYTPPCEKTDSMMEKVISFLEEWCTRKGIQIQSDHYTCVHPPCPRTLDMSTTLAATTDATAASPGQLVSYKTGKLPAWDVRDMVSLLGGEDQAPHG